MNDKLPYYINLFKKLRVDKKQGIPAPHKPILLLSVLQIFDNGINNSSKIYLTPEIVTLFKHNWSLLVTTNHNCNISYPFYHLKSSGFWNLKSKEGYNNIENMGSLVKSFSNLNSAIEYAEINDDLFQLMMDRRSNIMLQNSILDTYFPFTKNRLSQSKEEQFGLFKEIEDKILNEPATLYQKEIQFLIEKHDDEEIFIRGSVFKREIPKIYNNTCCISGMRVDATINISMLDACHIVPFNESHNDTISNGIALCPNLHRAFDRGLISIDSNYKVIVSNYFSESSSSYEIKMFNNKQIYLPQKKSHYPSIENIAWHRENIFKG